MNIDNPTSLRRRVVITGRGILSPLGCNIDTVWSRLINGESGIRFIDTFDVSDLPSKIAGLLPHDFNPDTYVEPKEQRKLDKFIIYALSASQNAFDDAGWNLLNDKQKAGTAVVVGSGIGGLPRLYETSVNLATEGVRRGVSPFFIPSVIGNMASGMVAIRFGLNGSNYSITSACSSGAHSIGEAFHQIRDGYCDFALAGGAESVLCRLGIAGFTAMHALSTSYNDTPKLASRPWDKKRDGFVMGEGAGILALETLESAEARGASVYGEIIGYGASCDSYHMTSPDPSAKGAELSIKRALEDANVETEVIEYINAHGTSTKQGDISEIQAIKNVFGKYAYNLSISSTKSATGHLLGATGAVEAIFTTEALRNNIVPPTINLENPDDGCDLDLTPNKAKPREMSIGLSCNFGFGGTNATLVFRAF